MSFSFFSFDLFPFHVYFNSSKEWDEIVENATGRRYECIVASLVSEPILFSLYCCRVTIYNSLPFIFALIWCSIESNQKNMNKNVYKQSEEWKSSSRSDYKELSFLIANKSTYFVTADDTCARFPRNEFPIFRKLLTTLNRSPNSLN